MDGKLHYMTLVVDKELQVFPEDVFLKCSCGHLRNLGVGPDIDVIVHAAQDHSKSVNEEATHG